MMENEIPLLIVEDDILLGKGLVKAFSLKRFNVSLAKNVKDAKEKTLTDFPQVIILDIGLPDQSGLVFLKWIKKNYPNIPVIILTAKDTIEDKIKGFEYGADDYLIKPFDFNELLARVDVQKRHFKILKTSIIILGHLRMNTDTRKVYYKEKIVNLTATEYEILNIFTMQPNRVHTKDNIECKIYSLNIDINSNAIEVHIYNLRKKISDNIIKTVRGVGYIAEPL